MSDIVSFTRMDAGTRADYQLLVRFESDYVARLPDRILRALQSLDTSLGGYQVTRLDHSLQSATRAHRNGENEEYVVATLLHDIGDELAPHCHSEMAAAILRPYVSDQTYWIIKHHGLFQMYYYAHHLDMDRNARDRYRDHPYFEATARFCELYDQISFDPEHDSLPLEFFEPMVQRQLGKTPRETLI